MNILITAPSLSPTQNVSGISTMVQTIILHNKQHNYYHYLLGRPDMKLNKLIWFFQLVRQLLLFPSSLKSNKIDLVHQNLPFDPKGVLREYFINLWCRLFHVPVVLHLHGGVFLMNGTNNPIFKKLSKSLFKHSKHVIVLSEVEKEALIKKYQYFSAKVLCNSINVSLYQSVSKQLPASKPILLFLGRIHESKGVTDIIEALRLLKRNMDFRFILCGTGPLKDHFIAACEQLLGSDFEYRGVVSGDSKINIIKESDIFLLPSRYGEGLPMALLETMAAGVVPVVTDDASMKYVVEHGKNGILVNKKDPKDLYLKLISVLSDSMHYRSLSQNASRTISEQFDVANYIVQLNQIYNSGMCYKDV
jgi:glycosyltransferase involved in cell wall biosynthesis